jgi:hypothetical protein
MQEETVWEKQTAEIFKTINAEIFPKLISNIKPQMQKVHRPLNKINSKMHT